MWKDWFYYSRRERNGTIVLVIIVAILLFLRLFMPKFEQAEPFDYSDYITKIDSFKQAMLEDSITQAALYEDLFAVENLCAFDPNTCDSSMLRKLGFGLNSISNIERYRSAGGKFNDAEDLLRIYSIADSEFAVLKPYIRIEQKKTFTHPRKTPTKKPFILEHRSPKKHELVERKAFELNTADTTQLKTLPGIGSVFAKRIVKYREWLGGFYSLNQLKEVYGMKPETITKLKTYLTIDTTLLKKIELNSASVGSLKNHPYIDFYQAKSIYEYRKQTGDINNFTTLLNIEKIDTSRFHKIKPYLTFTLK